MKPNYEELMKILEQVLLIQDLFETVNELYKRILKEIVVSFGELNIKKID